MRKTAAALVPLALALALLGGPAAAQQDLGEWDYQRLYAAGLRASDLLDRQVRAGGGEAIGTVSDLLFTRDGQVVALIVERPKGGAIALPFPGDEIGWDPETDYLELPYGSEVLGGLEPFEYGSLRTLWESRDLAPVQGQP